MFTKKQLKGIFNIDQVATLRQSVDEKQKEVEAAEKVAEELDVECQSLRKQLARAQVCVTMVIVDMSQTVGLWCSVSNYYVCPSRQVSFKPFDPFCVHAIF